MIFHNSKVVQRCVHYFLFDTKINGQSGGTGTFDWAIINELNIPLPYFYLVVYHIYEYSLGTTFGEPSTSY